MTKQDYANRAEVCLKGIECIKEAIDKASTQEEKERLALKFKDDLDILCRTYEESRAMYDPSFKK